MPTSTGINHIATGTPDLDRIIAFYRDVFGATVESEIAKRDDHPRMAIINIGGGAALNVFEVPDAEFGDRRVQGGRGAIDHYGIAVDNRDTLQTIKQRLTDAGADIGEINRLSDIWSLFFRDPDGMELEVCAPMTEAELAAAAQA